MQFPQFINIFPTDHDFNTDGKFTNIEKLQNTKLSKKASRKYSKSVRAFALKN